MTRIICISDTHNFHNNLKVPDGDILIHAGDFTLGGTLNEVLDFNDWLGTLNHKHKIVIAGNHDTCLGENDILGFKMITNGTYLLNSGVTVEGIKMWGSPLTPAFRGMRGGLTFHADRDGNAIKKTWQGIPKNLDVLITHGAPFRILDYVVNGNDAGKNVGDYILAEKIKQKKPKYHVFGHIHEGYGTIEVGKTRFINCSVVDEVYNLVNKPIMIDL